MAERTILLVGPFQRMYYLGERVIEWGSGPRRRRVPMDPPMVFWGQELNRGLRGTPAIRRTLAQQPNVYQTFIRERLLPALPLPGLVPQLRQRGPGPQIRSLPSRERPADFSVI